MSVQDLTQYIPHALATAAATVAGLGAYIFRDHTQRDDARFSKTFELLQLTNSKLDTAVTTQAANHAEILKILLTQAQQKSK